MHKNKRCINLTWYHLVIIASLSFTSACSGLTGAIGDSVQTGGADAGGNNAAETDSTDDSLPDDTENEIQAVLPMPENDGVIISNPDSGSVAYLQAEGLDSSYSLMVTNDSALARYEQHLKQMYFATINTLVGAPVQLATDLYKVSSGQMPKNRFLNRYVTGEEKFQLDPQDSWVAKVSDSLVKTAYAQTAEDPYEAANTVCLEISEDGTIVGGQLPGAQAGDSFTIKYVDRTSYAVSESSITEETKSLIYLADEPASEDALVYNESEDKIYALSDSGAFSKIELNAETESLEVTSGSAENNFSMFDSALVTAALDEVTALQYSEDRGHFVFGKEDSVLAQGWLGNSFGADEEDSIGVCLIGNCRPTNKIKIKNDRAYYGTRLTNPIDTDPAYIQELYTDNTGASARIRINASNDGIFFSRTLAFDVSVTSILDPSVPVAVGIAIIEDSDGVNYLSANSDFNDAALVYTPVALNGAVQDLLIYSEYPDDDSADGKAVILASSSLTFVDYDIFDYSGFGGDATNIVTTTTISWSDCSADQLDLRKVKISTIT